jgi:hypothetical protein
VGVHGVGSLMVEAGCGWPMSGSDGVSRRALVFEDVSGRAEGSQQLLSSSEEWLECGWKGSGEYSGGGLAPCPVSGGVHGRAKAICACGGPMLGDAVVCVYACMSMCVWVSQAQRGNARQRAHGQRVGVMQRDKATGACL